MNHLSLSLLSSVSGGHVFKTESCIYILSPGDKIDLPYFSIEYPNAEGPSNEYLLNGNPVHCLNNQIDNPDNMWTSPSDISSSFFSKNIITVQTDMSFLYVQANMVVPA